MGVLRLKVSLFWEIASLQFGTVKKSQPKLVLWFSFLLVLGKNAKNVTNALSKMIYPNT
jgi:hypothetical protein